MRAMRWLTQWQYIGANGCLGFVKKTFRMFALGVVPDVTGWTDITEEIGAPSKNNEKQQ